MLANAVEYRGEWWRVLASGVECCLMLLSAGQCWQVLLLECCCVLASLLSEGEGWRVVLSAVGCGAVEWWRVVTATRPAMNKHKL